MFPSQLILPEGADDWLEAVLASRTCPIHWTLDFDACDQCELEAMPPAQRRAAEAEPVYTVDR